MSIFSKIFGPKASKISFDYYLAHSVTWFCYSGGGWGYPDGSVLATSSEQAAKKLEKWFGKPTKSFSDVP